MPFFFFFLLKFDTLIPLGCDRSALLFTDSIFPFPLNPKFLFAKASPAAPTGSTRVSQDIARAEHNGLVETTTNDRSPLD